MTYHAKADLQRDKYPETFSKWKKNQSTIYKTCITLSASQTHSKRHHFTSGTFYWVWVNVCTLTHLFVKLPEAKEKQEYMLMLSENSEESATFFIITSMLLRSKKDFHSIHIQSCLQSTSGWTPQSDLCSEKKFLFPSLPKLLRGVWEAALKSNPVCSAEAPTDIEGPWFPSEYMIKRNHVTDPCALPWEATTT